MKSRGTGGAQGRRRPGLPASAGIHPHEAKLATETVYDELRGLARDERIVAVGEIGLDFHYDYSPRPSSARRSGGRCGWRARWVCR